MPRVGFQPAVVLLALLGASLQGCSRAPDRCAALCIGVTSGREHQHPFGAECSPVQGNDGQTSHYTVSWELQAKCDRCANEQANDRVTTGGRSGDQFRACVQAGGPSIGIVVGPRGRQGPGYSLAQAGARTAQGERDTRVMARGPANAPGGASWSELSQLKETLRAQVAAMAATHAKLEALRQREEQSDEE